MDNSTRGGKGVEQPPNFTYSRENIPFWKQDGDDSPITCPELLRAFLEDLCDDTGQDLYTEVEIKGFCQCLPEESADLNLLENGGSDEVRRPVALLDDRDIRGKCRPSQGALSAHQLYLELSKLRFVNRPGCSLPASSGSAIASPSQPETDAERRLIYITDVDRWSILAIIKTASPRQAGYYKDFIYRHLVSEAFLGVRIPILPRTFAYEFHLPFYVSRPHCYPIQDPRRRTDQKPLRNSWNLDFLDLDVDFDAHFRTRAAPPEYIYEVQVSLIVTGFEQSWVALSCVDTYHKGLDDIRESVQYYAEENKASEAEEDWDNHFKPDPLSKGAIDANRPIWDAKEYFLRILSGKNGTTLFIMSSHASVDTPYDHSYRLRTDDQSLDPIEKFNKQVDRFNETIRFLQQLVWQLSKTVDAFDSFQKDIGKHFSHFDSLQSSSDPGSLLSALEAHISELRKLRRKVTYQREQIESLKQQISQHLQQENNKIANLQHQNGEHMKLLAIIVLVRGELPCFPFTHLNL
ncbi:hypothetical protein V8F06_008076 [Rhypophila decipiens]